MHVKFINADGHEQVVDAVAGESILEIAKNNAIEGIIGECGGSMACATCHAYVDAAWADKLNTACELEQGMLSGCMDVRDGSRLTCQVVMSVELDGITIRIPASQV